MVGRERESTVITCRVCGGSGRCRECAAEVQAKTSCTACFYSGKCRTCGGGGNEVISRRFF